MNKIKQTIQRAVYISVVFLQITCYPAAVLADGVTNNEAPDSGTKLSQTSEQQPAPVSETPPDSKVENQSPTTQPSTQTQQQVQQPSQQFPEQGASNTGPSAPNGTGSDSYVYNPTAQVWENDVYTWDSATKRYVAKQQPQDPAYNSVTGTWETTEWTYVPELGTYVARPVTATINKTGSGSDNSIAGFGSGSFGISDTGAGSTNSIKDQGSFSGLVNLLFNGSVSNVIDSNSTSGNALVQGNTTAGDALTGDATAIANVLNMLQSSWFGLSSNVGGFVANIDGDVVGDLVVDPSKIVYGNGLPLDSNVNINVDSNAAINNDINLVATSGNATLDSNTRAGDAVTGDAYALANILNMINSAIIADHSFIGMLNIFGSLNGDIYLPAGILEQALIAGTGTNSTNQISGECQNNSQQTPACTNLYAATTATKTINNAITTNASSGDAILASNTQAGSGQSGSATTEVNNANLIGQNIAGRNALLVFVNVMGRWMGFFYNPAGQAVVTNTGADSANTITTNTNRSVSVSANENSLINNNINVAAHSGNATLSNNTVAGNAKTGNAAADVNIFNMIDSQINVHDFFGVLFINIFGDWLGSFGADTPAGNAPAAQGGADGDSAMTTTEGAASGLHPSAGTTPRSAGNPLVAAAYVLFHNPSSQESSSSNEVAVAGASHTSNTATPISPSSATSQPVHAAKTSQYHDTNRALALAIAMVALAAIIGGFTYLDKRYFIVDRLLA